MAVRQSAQPVQYSPSRRMDNTSLRTSGPAGVGIPVAVAPLHRGDSASGRILIQMELAEMPKPLENAVIGRAQAWFVPRPAFPQFTGLDEYTHSWHGEDITQLGASARTPPALFSTVGTGAIAAAQSSEFFKALGIALQASTAINTDYVDAYNLVQNFRLASHSSKMTRYDYYAENATTSLELKPALWPRNRMHDIVPDYEAALVKGSLDLDVAAGAVTLTGTAELTGFFTDGTVSSVTLDDLDGASQGSVSQSGLAVKRASSSGPADPMPAVDISGLDASLSGNTIQVSLADIDKARTTNAFAKAQAAYAGTDYSGFNNDDVIVSDLMQGFRVPQELFNRPWLLDSKTVVFGLNERHATDAANLDDSVTVGTASVSLSINIPRAEYGGIMIATVEVMPERLYERQSDEYLYCTDVDDLPNALRDIQRTEPVDTVLNRRVDVAHTTPGGTFGYEPMNAKWRREFTRLGGEFRQLTPGTPSTTARTAIWQADYVDPVFTSDHWLCPHPFPQDVFSAPSQDVVNISLLQQLTITGITQFGDDLVEDNQEFADVSAEV